MFTCASVFTCASLFTSVPVFTCSPVSSNWSNINYIWDSIDYMLTSFGNVNITYCSSIRVFTFWQYCANNAKNICPIYCQYFQLKANSSSMFLFNCEYFQYKASISFIEKKCPESVPSSKFVPLVNFCTYYCYLLLSL